MNNVIVVVVVVLVVVVCCCCVVVVVLLLLLLSLLFSFFFLINYSPLSLFSLSPQNRNNQKTLCYFWCSCSNFPPFLSPYPPFFWSCSCVYVLFDVWSVTFLFDGN